MRIVSQKELSEILEKHKKWLNEQHEEKWETSLKY